MLAADARRAGDAARGAGVFYARAMACSTCHSVGERADSIGPDLTTLDPKLSDADLIEAILLPSKTIAAAYATLTIETVDGRLLAGLPLEENDERLVLRDAAQPDTLITIRKDEIEQRLPARESIMPAGQVNQLADRQQFLDLVRYLIELREGGVARARQLQPPAEPTQKVPDEPLPWLPVVQRGEVAVEGNLRIPRSVALGFTGGTILFDADQLRTLATWNDGFVKSSPQNYFGLYWHRDGSPPDKFTEGPHPLRFKLSRETDWQSFEPAPTSDPNTGTRFDGYQIGKSAVRLHYHLLVGPQRIRVTEDVRAEDRPRWQGVAREYRFFDVPAGGQVSLALPPGEQFQGHDAEGQQAATSAGDAPMVAYRRGGGQHVARLRSADGTQWSSANSETAASWQLVSPPANAGEPLVMRVDTWRYRGEKPQPTAEELASLDQRAPVMNDSFDQPRQPTEPLPDVEDAPPSAPIAKRPAVDPQKNVDEFAPVEGRFLRFTVTGTRDNAAPGIDELEIYGADAERNLAPQGKATASSVISGYAIHQIPHLNDGKLGNNHSWISAEAGGGWVQIEFPEAVEMRKIVWARDQTGVCKDRLANAYRIEVSVDGARWTKVGDERGRAASAHNIGAIRRDASPGYVMETIPGPFPTWRPSDLAFGDDGSIYALAMTEGQVWRARTPPVGQPERVEWRRYACGLHHPIGLAFVDGRLYVAQKPELTELIDRDGDGTVDHYRTVATGWGLSPGWHEYCFGLGVDPQQNLWFALNTGLFWTHPGTDLVAPGRFRGSVLRVARETEQLEVMATGCRVPNGIAQGPGGTMFFTDNQGDWIEACKLAAIVPGRFYGHPENQEAVLPKETYPDGLSTVWLPYEHSRSVSGPVHDRTGGKFGPFADQMFVGDVGYGVNAGIMRIALEKVKGEYQGACFRFVDGQPLGSERMKFGPDHQLYTASLTSGLTRMAFDGPTPLAIREINIRPRGAGFVIRLTRPLAAETQLNAKQFQVRRYHYVYSGRYGSPRTGEQSVPVQAAELSADRASITLSLPVETHPGGMVYQMQLGKLIDEEGAELLHNEAWYTVHRLPD